MTDLNSSEMEKEPPLATSMSLIFIRLLGATAIALTVGALFYQIGEGIFIMVEGNIKPDGIIGFTVLLVSSMFMQSVFWSLPAYIPSVLEQSFNRAMYSYFEFCFRTVLVFMFVFFSILFIGPFGSSHIVATGSYIPKILNLSGEVILGLLTVNLFDFILQYQQSTRALIVYLLAFAVFSVQVSLFLHRIHLKERNVKTWMIIPLVFAINILLSFGYRLSSSALPADFGDELFRIRFWELQSGFSMESLTRVLIAWGCYTFASGLLAILAPELQGKPEEVATPSYEQVWRKRDYK